MKRSDCKCHAMVNEALAPRKAQLVGSMRLDGSTPKAIVATESNGETMRHKFMPVMLAANFCPFCGKKYAATKKGRDQALGGKSDAQ